MAKMNKYTIIVLLLALCSCSEKMPEPAPRVKKIKAKSYEETFVEKSPWGPIYDSMSVMRITNRDTVTYVYYKGSKRLNDTLKIYGDSVVFNTEKQNYLVAKKMFCNGKEINVYKFNYVDNRRVYSPCLVVTTFFINDSLGIFLKKVSSGVSTRTQFSDVEEKLQIKIYNDKDFFKG